jgi:hypothetical protein
MSLRGRPDLLPDDRSEPADTSSVRPTESSAFSERRPLLSRVARTVVISFLAGLVGCASAPPAGKPQEDPSRTRTSLESHDKGKWYFEVQIDHARIPKTLEGSLLIGVQGEYVFMASRPYRLRHKNMVFDFGNGDSLTVVGNLGDGISLPKVTVGIAVDLDKSKLYMRQDGEWLDGEPGSDRGTNLGHGRVYTAQILSSVPIENLIAQKIVDVNFGDKPIADPLPAGYAPFESSRNMPVGSVRLAFVEVMPPASDVAERPAAYWLQKQWEWLRGVPAADKPSADPTGARCADRQSGPVWFLAGREPSIPSPTVRSCDVPASAYVLVPIFDALVQLDLDKKSTCPALMQPLRYFMTGVVDLHLAVDGAVLPNPSLYRITTDCFKLDDVAKGVKGMMVAGSGYWVFLKPLPPGHHEITFGSTFTGGGGFTQDVKYLINVR